MRTLMITAAIAMIASTTACAARTAEDGGPVVTRNYPVGDFNQVEVGGSFDVDVRTGAHRSVIVRAEQGLIDRLEVGVEGGKLVIRPKKKNGWFGGNWTMRHKAEVQITVPQLTAATLAGSGTMRIDKVEGQAFDGQVAGSGDIRIGTVAVNALKLGIAGSGTAEAAGRANAASYEIAGSGTIKTAGLQTQDLKVEIAGSGDVRSHASRTAKVDIAGAGDVDIQGGAKCEVHKAGAGSVRCPQGANGS